MDLIETYFSAWLTHNSTDIERIFSQTAKYITPARTFDGHGDILAYWRRNAARQRNLSIQKCVSQKGAGSDTIAFAAQFDDIQAKLHQKLVGSMTMTYSDGQIIKLDETYKVESTDFSFLQRALLRIPLINRWSYRSNVTSPRDRNTADDDPPMTLRSRNFWLWVKSKGGEHWERFLLAGPTLIFTLVVIGFGITTYQLENMPDTMLAILSGNFRPPVGFDRVAAMPKAQSFLLKLAAFMCFLILPVFHFIYSRRNAISSVRLIADNQELDIMREAFHHAKALTIFSGSFGFLGRDQSLCRMLQDLAATGRLNLVSHRSQDVVVQRLKESPLATDLIQHLIRDQRIVFDHPEELHCSIVNKFNGRIFLYRHLLPTQGRTSEHYMCTLRDHQAAWYVIEAISRLKKSSVELLLRNRPVGT